MSAVYLIFIALCGNYYFEAYALFQVDEFIHVIKVFFSSFRFSFKNQFFRRLYFKNKNEQGLKDLKTTGATLNHVKCHFSDI